MDRAPIYQMDEGRALAVLESSLYPGAAHDSIRMVLSWAQARGVDPMDKPCHIVPMWDSKTERMRDVIMPSVDYYRQKAESTGEYLGLSDTEYGQTKTLQVGEFSIDYPEWAKVIVRRLVHGHVAEFPAKVFWLETYATKKRDTKVPNAMWQKRPFGQLEKCAEALALRRAFPKLCGGPTAEEMAGKTLDVDAIEVEPVRVLQPTVKAEPPKSEASKTESAPPPASGEPVPPPTGTHGRQEAGGADPVLTEGERAYITKKLKDASIKPEEFREQWGPLAEIQKSQFTDLKAWIKERA